MKRVFLLGLIGLLIGVTASAQQRYIKVFSGGEAVYSVPTTGSNSLRCVEGYASFSHNGETTTIALTEIDSMVFVMVTDGDTTGGNGSVIVDTASAISITWNGTSVAIVNPYADQGVSISNDGGHVTVNSTLDSAYLPYILGGSSSDGSLTITSVEKVLVRLDNLNLTSSTGPAIYMASDRKMLLDLVGTSTLCDAADGTHKGALQAAGKLAFQGTGAVSVSGMTKHAIQSSGRCTMNSGTVNVLTAVKDGMNVDDFIMYGGTVNVSNPNGDGIDGDQGVVEIYGGTVNVTVTADQSKGLKCGGDMKFLGGETTVNANGTLVITNYDPSYCTAIKAGGNLMMMSGTVTATCASSNAGGKAVSADGNIIVSGGTMNLTALGACVKYNTSATTYGSYASACLKANGNISISGGTVNANAGGRAITTDRNYTQTGGTVTTSTNGVGFTVTGTGTNCTDGFASACLKADSNIVFVAGTFNGSSTGKGGRGIVAGGTLTVGTLGAADSLLNIYVTTSGAAVNATSGGWPGGGESDNWKGLPKGVKIEGNITINSGHLQSYCSQTSGSTTGEAVESKDTLFIHGGTVEANAYDDAINAASYIQITGGMVWAYARGNDGMDCNGTRIDISGGTVILRGTEVAIDDNGDRGGKLYISGGTVILVGGNMGTTEATPQVTNQKAVKITSNTSTLLNNGLAIKNQTADSVVLTFKWPTVSGNGFMSYTLVPPTSTPKPPGPGGGGSGIYISSPALQTGNTYKYYSAPTISGGSHWHGLYDGATVTVSGNGSNLTLQ